MDARRRYRQIAAVILSVCMVCSNVTLARGEEAAASASTLRLTKTEGTVSATNQNGRSLPVFADMQLYSGYQAATQEASYAWISLDDSKLTKLDAVSEAEVRKKDKKLELLLKSGNLFFHVAEPLEGDETLDIRTSTMVTGIRGTAGWVQVIDGGHTQVYILEGSVQSAVSDPVTGQIRQISVGSGQMADFYVYGSGHASRCSAVLRTFDASEVPGFVCVEVAGDEALQQKIAAASGLDVGQITAGAWEKLAADQKELHDKLAAIQEQIRNQANQVTVDPVFQDQGSNSVTAGSDSHSGGSGGSGSGSGGSSSGGPGSSGGSQGTPSEPDGPSAPEEPGTPEEPDTPDGPDTPGEPDTPEEPDVPTDPEEPDETTAELTMQVTAAEVDALLQTKDVVIKAGTGDAAYNTLQIDVPVTVPEGRTLTMEDGVHLDVNAGQTLQIDGTLDLAGDMENHGTITNTSMNTFQVGGAFVNAGTIENTGRIIAGTVENTGILTIQTGSLVVTDALENDGTVENGGSLQREDGTGAAVANRGAFTIDGGQSGLITQSGDNARLVLAGGELPELDQQAGTMEVQGGTVSRKLEHKAGTAAVTGGTLAQGAAVSGGMFAVEGTGEVAGLEQTAGAVTVSGGAINGGTRLSGGQFTMTQGALIGSEACAALSMPVGSTAEVTVHGGSIDGGNGTAISIEGETTGKITLDLDRTTVQAASAASLFDLPAGQSTSSLAILQDGVSTDVTSANLPGCSIVDGKIRLDEIFADVRTALSEAEKGTTVVLEEDAVIEALSGGTDPDCQVSAGTAENPVGLDLGGYSLTLECPLVVTDTGALKITGGQEHAQGSAGPEAMDGAEPGTLTIDPDGRLENHGTLLLDGLTIDGGMSLIETSAADSQTAVCGITNSYICGSIPADGAVSGSLISAGDRSQLSISGSTLEVDMESSSERGTGIALITAEAAQENAASTEVVLEDAMLSVRNGVCGVQAKGGAAVTFGDGTTVQAADQSAAVQLLDGGKAVWEDASKLYLAGGAVGVELSGTGANQAVFYSQDVQAEQGSVVIHGSAVEGNEIYLDGAKLTLKDSTAVRLENSNRNTVNMSGAELTLQDSAVLVLDDSDENTCSWESAKLDLTASSAAELTGTQNNTITLTDVVVTAVDGDGGSGDPGETEGGSADEGGSEPPWWWPSDWPWPLLSGADTETYAEQGTENADPQGQEEHLGAVFSFQGSSGDALELYGSTVETESQIAVSMIGGVVLAMETDSGLDSYAWEEGENETESLLASSASTDGVVYIRRSGTSSAVLRLNGGTIANRTEGPAINWDSEEEGSVTFPAADKLGTVIKAKSENVLQLNGKQYNPDDDVYRIEQDGGYYYLRINPARFLILDEELASDSNWTVASGSNWDLEEDERGEGAEKASPSNWQSDPLTSQKGPDPQDREKTKTEQSLDQADTPDGLGSDIGQVLGANAAKTEERPSGAGRSDQRQDDSRSGGFGAGNGGRRLEDEDPIDQEGTEA